LKAAIEAGKLNGLAGFGKDLIARIAAGLEAPESEERRMRLDRARTIAGELIAALRERVPAITQMELAGSARRFRETVGDLDLVATWSRRRRTRRRSWRRSRGCRAWRAWRCAGRIAAE
jgi:DNA polymerase (family 10)